MYLGINMCMYVCVCVYITTINGRKKAMNLKEKKREGIFLGGFGEGKWKGNGIIILTSQKIKEIIKIFLIGHCHIINNNSYCPNYVLKKNNIFRGDPDKE